MKVDCIAQPAPIALGPLPKRPLISVLVSNYNYGRYIPQTIQSVLAQSYDNFELIICDDGSTDNSLEVMGSYVHNEGRIRLIAKENGGQASGFNAAYRVSAGDIICLLDSDDLYLPAKLERLAKSFERNPDAGFLVHRVIRVNTDRKRQGVWPMSANLPAGWYGSRMLYDGGIVPYMPPASGLTLRREVAEQLFPLPTASPFGMCPDQVIMRLAPFLSRIARIEEPLAEYRLHGRNGYAASRVTAQSIGRELMLNEQLWNLQKRFLESRDLNFGRLARLESSRTVLLMRYLRSRLAGCEDARARYREYLKALEGQSPSAMDRFWKLSTYVPEPLFASAVNLALGQNKVKQLIARLKRLA